MIYDGIYIDGSTDLRIIRNIALTDRQYKDEILRPVALSYAAKIGDYFMLIVGNCRPHRAYLVVCFFFKEGIA